MPRIHVHMLPKLVHPHETAGNTVVVVDVLRATTTIATALAAGARKVLPCLEISDAHEIAKRYRDRGDRVLLAGERKGLPIRGFDLGNSPNEFTKERIHGSTIVFTTTNGTTAFARTIGAGKVFAGAFVNLSRVWHAIEKESHVEILCAGTDDQIAREDVLFAGALADRADLSGGWDLNDQARIAVDAWRCVSRSTTDHEIESCRADLTSAIRSALLDSQGGRNLIQIGRQDDISVAADFDTINVLPQLDLTTWEIRAEDGHANQ